MRRNSIRGLTIVALLMMTIGIRAEQTVDVIVNPVNTGTVTYEISEGVCTLTVTPAAGYYLKELTAAAMLKGTAMQAPRRSIPMHDGTLAINAVNEFADSADVSSYKFEVPTEDYLNVEVTAEFEKGAVVVNGKAVTYINMNDIFGNQTVAFNSTTNTLTLNNAVIDMSSKTGYAVESSISDLKVLLKGDNLIKTNADAAMAFHYSNTEDVGTLAFITTESGFGTLTVEGDKIADRYVTNENTESATESGWRKTSAGGVIKISYLEFYNLWIGNTQFNSDALTITSGDGGKATYSNVKKTLSLKNFTTEDNITSALDDNLIVTILGINSVGAISGTEGKTLTILKNELSEADYNKLATTSITGFTVKVEEPLKEMTAGQVFSDMKTFKLWLNGKQVTDENKYTLVENVYFDGDHTLTLSDANVDVDNDFITNGLSELTINLEGKNTVACRQFLIANDEYSHKVTFTTSLNAAGKLTINNSFDWCTGHTVVYNNNLEKIEENVSVVIEAPETVYGLTIAGRQVTNLNASNVTDTNILAGTVSFDATENTLTLTDATITGNIESGIETLIVNLKGESSIGQFVKADGGERIIFTTEDVNGKLTMADAIDGLTALYRSNLKNINNVISLPETYGIAVNGIDITPNNRLHVLGVNDESVVFNGEQTLTLTNATLESITIAKDHLLPYDSLKIILIGNNTITNDANIAIDYKGTGGNLKLSFNTSGNESGKLIYNSTELNIISVDAAFNNCVVTYNNNLTAKINNMSSVVTVSTVLDPVVTEDAPVSETNFQDQMSANSNSNNQTVNGLLLTSGESSSAPQTTSGYDQTTGKFTFADNAQMSVSDLEEALKEEIGTAEYASKFIGITGILPAGVIDMVLSNVSLEATYDILIQIGSQEPISVRELLKITSSDEVVTEQEEVKFSVAVSMMLPFRIYLVKLASNTASAPLHRIGPKSSIAGSLGGVKISSNLVQNTQPPAPTYKMLERSVLTKSIEAVLRNARNGYVCSDENITNLPDNLFVDYSVSMVSRRAGDVKYLLPEDLTFVDFSKTKITGMEVNRKSGAFNGVPDNTFIYMPAGNTVAAGTRNVVIGAICDNMELNGDNNAQPFKAMKNFKAAQVTLKRTVEAYNDEKKAATIYLPYDVTQEDANQMGAFYQFEGIDNDVVQMTLVNAGGLKANTPYMFKAKDGGVVNPTARVVNVVANPEETECFKGVFERKEYEPGMYCYATEDMSNTAIGKFVEMSPDSYLPPFRAYMLGNGTSSYAVSWDGVIETSETVTAVETIKPVVKKMADGWWTLSGLRLNTQPTKSGMYIMNGRPVVVK